MTNQNTVTLEGEAGSCNYAVAIKMQHVLKAPAGRRDELILLYVQQQDIIDQCHTTWRCGDQDSENSMVD